MHIHFGRGYKDQNNYFLRFYYGGGTLCNIEHITDDLGQCVAAFWYHAGYAGAAVALLAWSHQVVQPNTPVPSIPEYPSATALVADVKACVASAVHHKGNQHPHILVMGALGRCGSGAVDFCHAVGLPESNLLKWNEGDKLDEKGPFPEIAASDIFINCTEYSGYVPHFITFDSLAQPGRKLRVACDARGGACHFHYNPMQIYDKYSTFDRPAIPVQVEGDGPPLTVIHIKNLPALVPREASEAFSELLLPSLKLLKGGYEIPWEHALSAFRWKLQAILYHVWDLDRWNGFSKSHDFGEDFGFGNPEDFGMERWDQLELDYENVQWDQWGVLDELSDSDELSELEPLGESGGLGEVEALASDALAELCNFNKLAV